jgi:hypothetical protein
MPFHLSISKFFYFDNFHQQALKYVWTYRWPVPNPCWRQQREGNSDDDYDGFKYCYENGEKFVLF